MTSVPADAASFPAWRERLAGANDPAFWPIEAVEEELTQGRAQFWANEEGAAVTRMIGYPGGAVVCECLCGSGTLDALWGTITPEIEKMAQFTGAKALHLMGRLGWERACPEGWRKFMVVMAKDLT